MNLNNGINLGGFLSQCVHTMEHYKSFITEQDISKIAELGFDHIRLPIDYEVIEDCNQAIKEETIIFVDKAVDWCKKYNLNIIIVGWWLKLNFQSTIIIYIDINI